ncbi:MAG TPA: hypothetical protein VML92_04005 [Steroidobacteraceae bacterium]|nr:hypothetical protein [Steroidobacteraceae bacterium]
MRRQQVMDADRQVDQAGTQQIDVTRTEQEAFAPFHRGYRRLVTTHDLAADQESDDRDRAADEVRHAETALHAAYHITG